MINLGVAQRIFRRSLSVLFILAAVYPQKVNIAILQFDAANISDAEVRILTDRLRTELIRISKYNVIERSVMEEVLDEQGFQQSGCVSTECVVEVGKLVGVEQMITGSMGKIGKLYTISARLVDVQTGTIISQTSLDCACPIESLLTKSMAELARKLSGAPPPPSRIPEGSVVFRANVDSVQIYYYKPEIVNTMRSSLIGVTPCSLTVEQPGNYQYLAAKPGYRDYIGDYTINSGSKTEINVEMSKEVGEIDVASTVSNTVVYIDGDSAGIAPIRVGNIEPGEHNVEALAKGFRKFSKKVIVQDLKTTEVLAELVAKHGTLIVKPSRYDQLFTLQIGDKTYSNIHQKELELPEATYNVLITEKGYYNLNKSITITDQSQTVLRAVNKINTAPVALETHPENARLTLSGSRYISSRSTYFSGDTLLLSTGNYTLRVKAPKYIPKSVHFNVDNPDPLHLSVHLNPKSPAIARRLSLLIPGSGQFYSNNTKRGIVFLGVTIGSLAMISTIYPRYVNQNNFLDDYRNEYQQARFPDELSSSKQLYQDQARKVNDIQNQLLLYSGVLAVNWLMNELDILFFNGLPDE